MKKKINILIAIVCISFTQALQYGVSPVLGQISSHFPNVDVSLVQMLVTVPALFAVVVAIISGWLVVKISKKKLLLFAAAVAAVTGFLPYLSDNFALLFVSRAVFGISLGIGTALNTAVVVDFFDGAERVAAMGIQGASVGAGMVAVTTISGLLGKNGFTHSYMINLIAVLALAGLLVFLPETGRTKVAAHEKIHINARVLRISFLGMLEFFFLISYTTNIAMYISGKLAGDTGVSGALTGIFAGAQILIGLLLGFVTRFTKRYTLPAAMLSFAVGAVILILFPDNFAFLSVGAVFCGFSQGIFVPQAMVECSNSVPQASAAMASACFTCAMEIGVLISPTCLNKASELIFGQATAGNVYRIAAAAMAVAAVISALYMKNEKTKGEKTK